jgi:4-hydroxythreonine-4-phosphate dehydrogenase
MKPHIALTMGDPSGIGPEIVVKAATDQNLLKHIDITVYGVKSVLEDAANRFNNGILPKKIKETGEIDEWSPHFYATPSPISGKVAYDTVVIATQDAIEKKIDAIVTAPMNKTSVNMANIQFTGHTELISEQCGCENFAMMQSSENLRVIFVTTHIGLREVCDVINIERIIEVTELLEHAIIQEGIANPKIAIAAINPHAGENGFMGIEDEAVTKRAVDELKELGIDVTGPFPPDTLFIESIRTQYDGIVSMYHDQGHIPFKMLAFDKGVNSTLGLPIIRTSVDHGTAFEIAWSDSGRPDLGSLYAAIQLAATRANNKRK